MTAPDLSTIDPAIWDEARRRLPVIRRLAEQPGRTRAAVVAAASELGCGPTYVYALLKRYVADPRLTSLLPGTARGPAGGFSLLAEEVDELIREGRKFKIVNVLLTQSPGLLDSQTRNLVVNVIKNQAYHSAGVEDSNTVLVTFQPIKTVKPTAASSTILNARPSMTSPNARRVTESVCSSRPRNPKTPSTT